jgi:hypothetical protein
MIYIGLICNVLAALLCGRAFIDPKTEGVTAIAYFILMGINIFFVCVAMQFILK